MGTVNIATIATSIAAYDVTGVDIKDIDKIPEAVTDRQCPIMFPDPDNFVTGFELSRESYGTDSTAKKDVKYTMNYLFLYCPVGATRTLAAAEDKLYTKAAAILDAFADDSNPSGAIDAVPVLGNAGVLQGPNGDNFFGCRIAINILTFYEVN